LLDLDPQTSAAEWKDVRAQESPASMAVPAARLQRVIDRAKEIGTDILIIDTAPHSEGTALATARLQYRTAISSTKGRRPTAM
jgi:chromosome partitioning protein